MATKVTTTPPPHHAMKSPIPFRAFDERAAVRIYHHGTLPHWRQDGCTYFVTFRLADSLPHSVVAKLKEKRNQWLIRHQINPLSNNWRDELSRLPDEERREYERQMAKALNTELDVGYGSCVLRTPEISAIAASGLEHHHGTGMWTGDYIIMPNHVHALLTPLAPHTLEDVLKSIKGRTAIDINRAIDSKGKLWQRDSYEHIVRNVEQLRAFQTYIRDNPTEPNLKAGEYRHSNAEYTIDRHPR